MLFSKKIEPRCSYCQRGRALDAESILCVKRGITTPDNACSAFRYDPLKRVPPRPVAPDFSQLKEEDFRL